MAPSDPNLIGQIDSRILNIESKVEQRFDTIEKRFDDFVEQLKVMMQAIEDDEKTVKAELRDNLDVLALSTNKTTAEVQSAILVAQSSASALGKRTEGEIVNEIGSLKNVINRVGQSSVQN